MSDPVRLMDDPHVGASLRDDLRAAQLEGFAFDVDAEVARFRQTTGSGGGSGGAAGAAGTGGAIAWGAAGLGMLSLVAIGIWLTRPEAQPPAHGPTVADTEQEPHGTLEPTPVELPEPEPEPEPSIASPVAPEPRQPAARRTKRRADVAERGDTVHREMVQLDQIRQRFARGDDAGALQLCEEGQREFRGGLFTEEREAFAVRALGRLGRDAAARRRAVTFLRRWPDSTHASAVRAIAEPEE